MTLKNDAKSEEKLIYFFKNDKSLINFDPRIDSFCAKYITFDLKKYREIISDY